MTGATVKQQQFSFFLNVPFLNLLEPLVPLSNFQIQHLSWSKEVGQCVFHLCLLFFSSHSLNFVVCMDRTMTVKGILGLPAPRHPCKLFEGGRMAEGLWRCGSMNTGGRCRCLVPTTAGHGRVGVWVLKVDSPMSCCMCWVLGVCFWHLFCYIMGTKYIDTSVDRFSLLNKMHYISTLCLLNSPGKILFK